MATAVKTNLSSNVIALFQSAADSYASSDAATGESWMDAWPEDGEHDALISSIDVSEGEFFLADGSGRTVPCAQVVFEFIVLPDENDPDYEPSTENKPFSGARFQILDPMSIPSDDHESFSSRARIEMNIRRLKGHVSRTLGREPQQCLDPLSELSTIIDAVSEGRRPIVRLVIQTRQKKYKTEYIKALVSGVE